MLATRVCCGICSRSDASRMFPSAAIRASTAVCAGIRLVGVSSSMGFGLDGKVHYAIARGADYAERRVDADCQLGPTNSAKSHGGSDRLYRFGGTGCVTVFVTILTSVRNCVTLLVTVVIDGTHAPGGGRHQRTRRGRASHIPRVARVHTFPKRTNAMNNAGTSPAGC